MSSLFTIVSIDEVLDICGDTLYRLGIPSIGKNKFCKLLKLSNSGVKFKFN